MDSVSRVGAGASPRPLLVCWLWSLINQGGHGTSEGPQPSRTTWPCTWAEKRRFLSHEVRGAVFPDQGGSSTLGSTGRESCVIRGLIHPVPCGARACGWVHLLFLDRLQPFWALRVSSYVPSCTVCTLEGGGRAASSNRLGDTLFRAGWIGVSMGRAAIQE